MAIFFLKKFAKRRENQRDFDVSKNENHNTLSFFYHLSNFEPHRIYSAIKKMLVN